VRELSPAGLVFFRTAPAALMLAPLALRRGQPRLVLAHWRWVLTLAAVELAVPWLLLSSAEKQLTSSTAGLLVAAVPLMGAVLYRLAGAAEPMDARRLVGLFVGFAGVAALVGVNIGGSPRAVAEVLVVALCYATGPLIISRKLDGVPGLGVIAASLSVTAVVYAAPALATLPKAVSADTVAAVATLAVVCTALAFLLFFALIREVGPSRSTVITYINPLVAVLLGVTTLGEPFTIGIACGLPLILVGSVLATARPRRRSEREIPASAPTP
jgi:drug/metabolite transporter (DMT)-like permease